MQGNDQSFIIHSFPCNSEAHPKWRRKNRIPINMVSVHAIVTPSIPVNINGREKEIMFLKSNFGFTSLFIILYVIDLNINIETIVDIANDKIYIQLNKYNEAEIYITKIKNIRLSIFSERLSDTIAYSGFLKAKK